MDLAKFNFFRARKVILKYVNETARLRYSRSQMKDCSETVALL